MTRIIIISAIFLTGFVSLHAQNKHEISLSGFGGLSGLKYGVTTGSQKSGFFGGSFGLDYAHFFAEQMGVRTGLELAFFGAEFNMNGENLKYPAKDMDGASFEFRSKIAEYEETQRAMMLLIPVMAQYQTGKIYAALGCKVGIPLRANYQTAAMTVQNSGFYAEENFEYATQTFMGFGKFDLPATDNALTLKTTVFLSVEAGGKIKLSDKFSLYAGIFLDYGVSNIADTGTSPLIEYNSQTPGEFGLNGVVNAGYAEKMNPIAAGVKVRIAFGKGTYF